MITKKMSLFDAPEGAILVHGCNAQGAWGAGIAALFAEKYPRSSQEYKEFCQRFLSINEGYGAVGLAHLSSQENKRFVGSLITSFGYGRQKDSPAFIIAQTYLAINDFFQTYKTERYGGRPIYCNKFNSGMFKVPWHSTVDIIKYFENRYKVEFVVCDPDSELT